MRLVVFLLVAGSLVLGLMAAASAYLAPLSLADDDLIGLTAADTILDPSTRQPILKKGAAVDGVNLVALRGAGVGRLRVEEFDFGRWRERWLFVLASGGLLCGSLMARRGAKRRAGAEAALVSPEAALSSIESAVGSILADWPTGSDSRVSTSLLQALGPVVEESIPVFVAGRPAIVGRLGLAGYAGVMDRFAAAERQIHRAWSAAADGVPLESRDCLARARFLLEETRSALRG